MNCLPCIYWQDPIPCRGKEGRPGAREREIPFPEMVSTKRSPTNSQGMMKRGGALDVPPL